MAKSSLTLSSSLILLCSVLALSLLTAVIQVEALGGKVGGRQKIPDVKSNEKIQDLGRYSVSEYNNNIKKYQKGTRSDGPVTFLAVVEAETQVVNGINYYLQISSTSSSGRPRTFQAVVWVHSGTAQSKELVTFSPTPPTK